MLTNSTSWTSKLLKNKKCRSLKHYHTLNGRQLKNLNYSVFFQLNYLSRFIDELFQIYASVNVKQPPLKYFQSDFF